MINIWYVYHGVFKSIYPEIYVNVCEISFFYMLYLVTVIHIFYILRFLLCTVIVNVFRSVTEIAEVLAMRRKFSLAFLSLLGSYYLNTRQTYLINVSGPYARTEGLESNCSIDCSHVESIAIINNIKVAASLYMCSTISIKH